MDEIQKALLETFRSETLELLGELETALLELEESPGDMELIGKIFRALHTIKGNGSMFGFDEISSFTHDIESVYDLVRDSQLEVNKELIDLTLRSRDIILEMLNSTGELPPEIADSAQKLKEAFADLIPGQKDNEMITKSPTANRNNISASESFGPAVTYRIRFVPEKDLFLRGTNPVALLNELASLGECFAVSNMSNVPTLDKYDPENCYTYWDIILVSEEGIDSIRDMFIFVEGHCKLSIEVIDEDVLVDRNGEYKKLGEILIERGDLTSDELERVLSEQRSIGQDLIDKKLVESGIIESALLEQTVVREDRLKRHTTDTASSIRVASEKLDSLVNLVGELVTAQARLSRTAHEKSDPEIVNIAEVIELLTWELRDIAFSIRMLPIGSTFSKYRRLVRDLSSEMGKEVNLVTEGAETELDKTVIEKLNDPLTHLIRNCIDHGLEDPERREAEGKPRCGTIKLSAHHSGAEVLIKISDDGSGFDESSIRERAIEKGLIAEDADIHGSDIYSLIFTPGFSTAAIVSNISGRGVGLDIVKKSVEALRGSVQLDSEKGRGTTVTIRLPLTLAIIEGLEVDIGGDRYILPLSTVEECVELDGSTSAFSGKRQMAEVRGEVVPYIKLREWFAVEGDRPEREQIVITNNESQRVGFVVDSVIGEHQTVIKSLGKVYSNVEGISGATVLGDGSIALILDVPQLVRIVRENERTTERQC